MTFLQNLVIAVVCSTILGYSFMAGMNMLGKNIQWAVKHLEKK